MRAPIWAGYCHCESCRRAASSAIVAWMGFRQSDVLFNGSITYYSSSDDCQRGFCPTCGSPLSYQSKRWPEEIHLYAATLENPALFKPEFHVHVNEKSEWVKWDDGLPQHCASLGPSDQS